MLNPSRTARRAGAVTSLVALALVSLFAASCKRTFDICNDPIVAPCNECTCVPTLEVVNCTNPPSCASTTVSACSSCSSASLAQCGTTPGPICYNVLCYRMSALGHGFTITDQRAYWPNLAAPAPTFTPAPWIPVPGAAEQVDRGKTGRTISFAWCNASMTPVVGLQGQLLWLEVKGTYDDGSPMQVKTSWRP